MAPPKSNPPPIFMDVFNAYIKHVDHSTFQMVGIPLLTESCCQPSKGRCKQSKVFSSALPLHCYFDNNNNSVQQTTHNDDLLIWASRHQAVAFTPTATTIWTSMALQFLPLINNTPQSVAAATTMTFLIMVVSQIITFLAQKLVPVE